MNNLDNSFQKNITVSDLIFESLKRWYFIVGAIVAALLITFIYTSNFMTPMYTSRAKILVLSKQTGNQYTSTDFSISTYLSNDFAEIIVDTPVLEPTSEDLDGKYSVNSLKGIVSVNKPENTRIIEISARTPVPEDSRAIVDSVCKNAKETLVDLMNLDSIEILTKATTPTSPSSPNLSYNLVIAFFAAFLISELVIALNFIYNNKISSPDDIQKYLGLNVLATIPYNHSKIKGK